MLVYSNYNKNLFCHVRQEKKSVKDTGYIHSKAE